MIPEWNGNPSQDPVCCLCDLPVSFFCAMRLYVRRGFGLVVRGSKREAEA
jgi:hypothetical protein